MAVQALAPNFFYTNFVMGQNQSTLYLEILNNSTLRYFSTNSEKLSSLNVNQEDSLEAKLDTISTWLKNNPSEVVALFQPICFSLVPKLLFEPSSAPHYLDLLHENLESSFVSYEPLEKSDIELVYALQKSLVNLLEKKLENISIQSNYSSLLDWIAKESKSTANNSLWMLNEGNEMCLALFNNGRLLFFNAFNTETWQDQLYYCMALCEQQDIKPKSTQLNLLGNNNSNELLKNLKAQFSNIKTYESLSGKDGPSSIQIESTYLCA